MTNSPDHGTRGWRALFPGRPVAAAMTRPHCCGTTRRGVTLAAYAIPVSLAYATLAGCRRSTASTAICVAGLGYALFGTSRQLAIGPTSAISMLVGATSRAWPGRPGALRAIASLTALWSPRRRHRLGAAPVSLVNFISETVLLGFKAGAALTIAMTQLPKLFGVKGGGDHFFERLWTLVGELPDTNLVVLAFGLVAIGCWCRRPTPSRRPVALFVVALAIVALSLTPLARWASRPSARCPTDCRFALPALRPATSTASFRSRSRASCSPTSRASRRRARWRSKHGDEIDPRQELLALGAANLAAAFGHGYPVAGGLSQSTVNDKAGARTPLSLVFASARSRCASLFLTGLLRNLPDVVLAAIVLVAVKGLVDVAELARRGR